MSITLFHEAVGALVILLFTAISLWPRGEDDSE